MIPFSNGTQYLDWEASNCGRCKKAATREQMESSKPLPCDIEDALAMGTITGEISDEIAKRMTISKERYVWKCGEWEPTEEWKAKVNAARLGK